MFLKFLFKYIHLIIFFRQNHIIECVLNFVENHSVFVGIVSSLIIGSLWFRKYLKQKRAEAFFGFYSKLVINIKLLRELLDNDNQLCVTDHSEGNIFSLIYTDDCLKTFCPRYCRPNEDRIKEYGNIAFEIKRIIGTTDNNVFPANSSQKKWYESQFVILSFCNFITGYESICKTNENIDKTTKEYKHIDKCKKLIDAMDYMQESIEKVKY